MIPVLGEPAELKSYLYEELFETYPYLLKQLKKDKLQYKELDTGMSLWFSVESVVGSIGCVNIHIKNKEATVRSLLIMPVMRRKGYCAAMLSEALEYTARNYDVTMFKGFFNSNSWKCAQNLGFYKQSENKKTLVTYATKAI